MKERPILFSAPMVSALLDGSKTQTRRVMKVQPSGEDFQLLRVMSTTGPKKHEGKLHWAKLSDNKLRVLQSDEAHFDCPYGKVGDRLWVRETTKADYDTSDTVVLAKYASDDEYVTYDHDDRYKDCIDHWWYSKDVCPSIHMPRDKSRINLEITGVRVERLNDISEADAKAEGLKYHSIYNEWGGVEAHPDSSPMLPQWRWYESPIEAFKNLWESINCDGSWDANPWVWVIEFKRV